MRRAHRSHEGPGVAMRDVLLVERVDGDGVGEEEEGAQQEQVVHLETWGNAPERPQHHRHLVKMDINTP